MSKKYFKKISKKVLTLIVTCETMYSQAGTHRSAGRIKVWEVTIMIYTNVLWLGAGMARSGWQI